MITDVEDYFAKGCDRCARFDTDRCSTRIWAEGLARLRRICRDMGLEETAKWGHPCYMHAGRNVVLINALQGVFRLSFMNPALMTDPEGLLTKNGPNTLHAGNLDFTDADEVTAREETIRAYLAEAMDYAERGVVPPKVEREIDMPDELVAALDDDPELAEAWDALTPGRQRSYTINLGGAKKPATRVARIAKFREGILAGKGALER